MNLKKTFIKNKNKIDLIEKNLEITYAELLNEINKIFSFLHKKKFLILLTSNNTKEFIAIYAGSLINNKTPLLIDQNTDEISLSNIINLYKPKYVFIKKIILKNLKPSINLKNMLLLKQILNKK